MSSRVRTLRSFLVMLLLAWACVSSSRLLLAVSPRDTLPYVATKLNNSSNLTKQAYRPEEHTDLSAQQTADVLVLDVTTKKPVAGARVDVGWLGSRSSGTGESSCLTNRTGQCRIEMPEQGQITVGVSAGGYSPQELTIELSSAESPPDLTFTIERERHSKEPLEKAVPTVRPLSSPEVGGEWRPILSESRTEAKLVGKTAIADNQGHIRISFTLPGLIQSAAGTGIGKGTIFKIPNGFLSLHAGMPIIPAMAGKFAMPPGAVISRVRTVKDVVVELDYIEPTLHVPVRITPRGLVRENVELRELSAIYPSETFRVRKPNGKSNTP